MTRRRDNDTFNKIQNQMDFEYAVVQAYESGQFLTKKIADVYGISPKSVQRIAKKWDVVRSPADGNRVAAPLAPKHRLRKVKPLKSNSAANQLGDLKPIVIQLLKQLGRDFSKCQQCGTHLTPKTFQLHHTKYEGATLYDIQIVCVTCNNSAANRYLA